MALPTHLATVAPGYWMLMAGFTGGCAVVLVAGWWLHRLRQEDRVARPATPAANAQDAALFTSVFDDAPTGMPLLSLDGRWLQVNRALCEMLGYTKDEIEGQRFEGFTHPEDRERCQSDLHRLIAGEILVSHAERRYRAKNGTDIWMHRSATVVRGPDGAAPFVIVHLVDVSEAKRAHHHSRRQAELLNQTSDAIVATDLEGRVTLWNSAAARLTGHAVPDADGHRLTELLEVKIQPPSSLGTAAPTNGVQRWMLRRRDGAPLLWDARTTSIVDVNGSTTGRITVATDVTEKTRVEEQLLHAQRIDGLGLLAAGITHDLNNMLAPIMMAAPLLRDAVRSATDKALAETIAVSATRAAALSRQVLNFSHRATGDAVQVSTRTLLQEVLTVVRGTFPRSIEIVSEVAPDLAPIVANPTHLHQIVINLCVNARDAMPRGGTLRLTAANHVRGSDTTELRGTWVVIAVAGTGTGIPPEVEARMWEPFYTTKPPGHGTGLGLATVKAIVEKHHGFIRVETATNAGTTFRIYLPAAAPVSSPSAEVVIRRAPQPPGGLVLLADDEESIRHVVSAVLIEHGFRVLVARDGAETLTLFRENADEIDVVLTDIDMPELDGLALLGQLRGPCRQSRHPDDRVGHATGSRRCLPAHVLPREAVYAGSARVARRKRGPTPATFCPTRRTHTARRADSGVTTRGAELRRCAPITSYGGLGGLPGPAEGGRLRDRCVRQVPCGYRRNFCVRFPRPRQYQCERHARRCRTPATVRGRQ